MISSLVEIQSWAAESKEAKEILADLNARVRALADLYSMLYETKIPGMIDLKEYCNKVIHSIAGMSADIDVNKDLENIEAPMKDAATIGLILTELLTNAVKHGFKNHSKNNIIEVSLKKNRNDIIMDVTDNGTGLPEDFSFSHCSGIGLEMTTRMIKQFNGDVRVIDSKEGAHFRVSFPDFIK